MNAKLKVVSHEKENEETMRAVSDPLEMLKMDHDHVKENFEKFESASGEGEKYSIFVDTVLSLVVHTKLEEELVYPLLEESDDEEDEDMKLEAEEEHRVVDFVITEMKGMDESDEKFDAKFKVLSELVKHHIKEEEEEMFPSLRELDIDFDELKEKMLDLKMELQETYSDLDAVEPLESPAMQKATKKKPAAKSKAKTTAAKKTAKPKQKGRTATKTKTKAGAKKASSKASGKTASKTGTKTSSKAKSKTSSSKTRASSTKKSTAKKTGAKSKPASTAGRKKASTTQSKRKKSR